MWCGGFGACSEKEKIAMVWGACRGEKRVTPLGEWGSCWWKEDGLLDAQRSPGRGLWRRTCAWWEHAMKMLWTETDGGALSSVKPPARGYHDVKWRN